MKKTFKRIMFLSFSLILLVNLSGCAKVINSKTHGVYPLNYTYFWDRIFVQPVAVTMYYISNHMGGFYAVGIILTTIIIRTILFPVYTKSNDTQVRMQAIQPESKKIQEKYAGKTDPDSRNKMQFEMMKLYKDNNVNMLAGCLMPFLQMPVFLAMYNAVVKLPVTDKYKGLNQSFLWLNLSAKDPYWILPILVAVTAILLQYISMYGLSPEAKNNPTMKMMMWLMPGMMFVFSFTQVASLSLYWIIGNIYSTLQIIVVKRPFKKDKETDNVVNAKFKEVK